MKSIRRLYAPLGYMAVLFLFFYLSGILCGHWVRLELLSSYDNTPYREEAVMFLLTAQGQTSIDLTEAAEDGILSGCAVLRYDEESYGTNEVIYCDAGVIGIHGTGEIAGNDGVVGSDGTKEIKESHDGEAFDFLSGEKAAVAGAASGYAPGDTVTVDGTAYPVAGILEEHISIAINTGVFYSRGDLAHVSTQEIYVLTARDKDRIADAYARLEELVQEKGAEIRSREISKARYTDYVDYRGVTVFLLGVLAVFYLGLICLFAYMWLRIKGPEVHVLNLLGYGHIRRKVWAEYSAVWTAAFLLSFGVSCGLSSRVWMRYCAVPVFGVSAGLLILAVSGGYVFFRLRIRD